MDFRGLDSSIVLILRGGILISVGDSPEKFESTNLSRDNLSRETGHVYIYIYIYMYTHTYYYYSYYYYYYYYYYYSNSYNYSYHYYRYRSRGFPGNVESSNASGGRLCTLIGVPCRISMLSTLSTFANVSF